MERYHEEEIIPQTETIEEINYTQPIIINLRHRKHVAWLSDVIDNEGMGKRSSKSIFYSIFY